MVINTTVTVSYIQSTSCSLIWISRVATTYDDTSDDPTACIEANNLPPPNPDQPPTTDIDVGYEDIIYEPISASGRSKFRMHRQHGN